MIERISSPAAIDRMVAKAHEYLSPSKVYSEKELAAAAEKQAKKVANKVQDTFTSPYKPISTKTADFSAAEAAKQLELSYARSHGIPEEIARESGKGINLFTSI